MNSYYINYKFNKMCLETLDDKYKNTISLNNESYIYLYVNLIEISKFFELYHPFKQSVSLYTKFNNNPDKMIHGLINYIKTHGYNPNDILLLYSICAYIVIKNSSFFNTLGLNDDKMYANFKQYSKIFPESQRFNLYILDTLDTVLKDNYNILETRTYLNLALDKYNLYLRHPHLVKFKYNVLSVFKKNKNFKLKNKALKLIKKDEIDENLDMLLFEYKELINHVNNSLYFSKEEKLINFIKNNMGL